MKVEIHTAHKPHRSTNDDIAGHAGSVYWLLDGATQMNDPAHGLTAAWHVRRIDASFRRLVAQAPDMSLAAMAKTAIEETAEEFFRVSGLDATAPQELRPFATLVLCRVRDDLEYLIVCDSTLAVVGPEKETVISDGRIDEGNFLEHTDALLRTGLGYEAEAYRAAMKNLYAAVTKKLNRPGGFDVVGQDRSIVGRALTGRIPLGPGDHVLLASDGFARAVEELALYPSWTALLQALEEKGGARLLEEIRAAERDDADGRSHPRSSRHDDATLLWIRPE